MTDVHSREQRRRNMSRVRSKDTGPELLLRRLLFALGYRYRLHTKDLPGKPDVVFASRRKVIFVHGCFWHVHACSAGRSTPETNAQFWHAKRRANVIRDVQVLDALQGSGWQVLVIWQCELKKPKMIARRAKRFLGNPRHCDPKTLVSLPR